MTFKKRLSALEAKQPKGDMRFYVARPADGDDSLIRLQQNGHDEYQVMAEDEFKKWERVQDDNVQVYRLVYEDMLNN